jgi:hypothetical protein
MELRRESIRLNSVVGGDGDYRRHTLLALAAANEGRRARLRGGDAGDVVIQLTREQFNARLANGHQIELFDEGKGCRIVGRDEEAELEWFEDYWQ